MSATTLAGLLRARAGDDRSGLLFEDRVWTWREYVAECAARAAWLDARAEERAGLPGADGRPPKARPLHVGILLDNVPELLFLLGAAALSGHVIVALNTTRTPAELTRDATATNVGLIVHEPHHAPAAQHLSTALDVKAIPESSLATPAPAGVRSDLGREPGELVMLIFTSGTSGRPRAVRVTQRKIAVPGVSLGGMLTADDVVYCSMPLFHSAAIMAAYAPAVASGAALVVRRRFSASGVIPDVRRYGCTYLHYVGKALSYVLATPERPDDADNSLRIAFGNEGSAVATRRFGERFGCRVIDAFGSTETAIAITPDPSGPAGCLGRLPEGVEIRDPLTGGRCAPARVVDGRLLNADEAIGELVNTTGAGLFDGYYNDPDADRERVRAGAFWSGDMAYADEDGYVFFAGRGTERLRVDGENLAVAPIETVVRDFPGAIEAAVYPVPDAAAGDQVMAALVLDDSVRTDELGRALGEFLTGRGDLGPKSIPRYIRISRELPQTPSHKVLKRVLAKEGWQTGDPVWWRPPGTREFRRLTPNDLTTIENEFTRYGRQHLLYSQGSAGPEGAGLGSGLG
jgi:fatty-acyl-CoA synthase